jgi:acetylornithine deacetylase/succinyl-diaminopimelate desuccinylase-like protein
VRKTVLSGSQLMVIALVVASGGASAQEPLLSRPDVAAALSYLERHHQEHVEKQITIAEIAAPGGQEGRRAQFMRAEFQRVGLTDVAIDPEGNVLGWRKGRSPRTLVIAAHLDTVFPAGTDVKVKRNGSTIAGPGVTDDARGLTCLLGLAEALNQAHIRTERTLLFVADVGEEGLGNLHGVKYLFEKSPVRRQIEAFITIDGTGLDQIGNRAIGSRRYRVTVRGPGGHSSGDFGIVSPVHAVGRVIALVSAFEVPASPRTTYNVGLIGGGTAVNAVAFESWLEMDMRSEGAAELAALEARFLAAVRAGVDEENRFRAKSGTRLTVDSKLVGDRPVAGTAEAAPLVKAALRATRAMGVDPRLAAGSTDAGAPMSLGFQAISLGGGGEATGVHSLLETFESAGAFKGIQRALLVILAFDESPALALAPAQAVR